MNRRKFAKTIAAVATAAAAKPVVGAPPTTGKPVAKAVIRRPVPVKKS